MTKKDYELVASVLRAIISENASDELAYRLKRHIVAELCVAFTNDNPSFNALKFLQACNVIKE